VFNITDDDLSPVPNPANISPTLLALPELPLSIENMLEALPLKLLNIFPKVPPATNSMVAVTIGIALITSDKVIDAPTPNGAVSNLVPDITNSAMLDASYVALYIVYSVSLEAIPVPHEYMKFDNAFSKYFVPY